MRLSRLTPIAACTATILTLTACGDDSDHTTIIDGTPPLITTDSNFSNGYSAVAAIFVSGQVQDSSGVKSLTYSHNGQPAQALTLDAEGYFDDRILLTLGSNRIVLEATDNAGNIMRKVKTLYLGDTIAAGGSHTGALRDGQLYGWGRNNYGQTGLGLTTKFTDVMGHPVTPMLMRSAPKDVMSISFNQNHSLAIAQNGQVYSWGEDKYGQLGRGDSGRHDCSKTADCRLDISTIDGIENAVMVAAGYKHNLLLTKDGSVWAFGANGQGQLGDNTSRDSSTPVEVDFSAAAEAGHIVQVVASANSSYALDDKGQVWGWGSDAYANLGKGAACTLANDCTNINATPVRINVLGNSTVDKTTPAKDDTALSTEAALSTEKVTQLAAGRDHILALTNKEAVYGWGLNAASQLGYNGETYQGTPNAWADIITTPTKLPWFTDKDVRRVYANGNASYALIDNVATNSIATNAASDNAASENAVSDNAATTNGVLYAWGMFGETNGAGKTIYHDLDEPTNKLPSLKDIDNMAMGAMHLIAHQKPQIQDDDAVNEDAAKAEQLFTWGWSFEGSLGNADTAHVWMYNNPIIVTLPSQL
ncbi:chromosome condensation regulator RCC1 [Psychrobacter celer]|uniref:chromosome condensation regulator RCC1 n=1 Tax=Psychrobacter celer TaxID=306572 RepID=UPI003FD14783